jgi:ribonuclease-3
MQELNNLLKSLGLKPKNLALFNQAFTHTQYRNEKKADGDYERLEFLGDAIISQVVSEFLFTEYKEKNAGELSKLRALITQNKTQLIAAKQLKLEKFIKFNGVIVDSILADVYEAFIAAIYFECGREASTKIIHDTLIKTFQLHRDEINEDYKTRLQELTYKIFKTIPTYSSTREKDREFTIRLLINDKVYAEVKGKKIKEAEQKAAKEVFLQLSEK